MLKILQARLQPYIFCKLPHVQAGFRKGRGTRYQIANICWIIEKQEGSRNLFFLFPLYYLFPLYTSIFSLLTVTKPITMWITRNCRKFKVMGIPDHLTSLLRNLYVGQGATVRTGHWAWNNRLVPRWERSMSKLYIVIH